MPTTLLSVLRRDAMFLCNHPPLVRVVLNNDGGLLVVREASRVFVQLRFGAFEGLIREGSDLNLGRVDCCGEGFDAKVWDDALLYVSGEPVRNLGLVGLVKVIEFLHVWNVQPEELLLCAVCRLNSALANMITDKEVVDWTVEAVGAIYVHSHYLVTLLGVDFIDILRKRFVQLLQCDLSGFPLSVMGELLDHNSLLIQSEADVLAVVCRWADQNDGYSGLLEKIRPSVPKRVLDALLSGDDGNLREFACGALEARKRNLMCREGDFTLHPDLYWALLNGVRNGEEAFRDYDVTESSVTVSQGVLVTGTLGGLNLSHSSSRVRSVQLSYGWMPEMLMVKGGIVFGVADSHLFSVTFDGRVQSVDVGAYITCMDVGDSNIFYATSRDLAASVKKRFVSHVGDLGNTDTQLVRVNKKVDNMVAVADRIIFTTTKTIFSRGSLVDGRRSFESSIQSVAVSDHVAVGLESFLVHIVHLETLQDMHVVCSDLMPETLFLRGGFLFVAGLKQHPAAMSGFPSEKSMWCYDVEDPLVQYKLNVWGEDVLAIDTHGNVLSVVTTSHHLLFKHSSVKTASTRPSKKRLKGKNCPN